MASERHDPASGLLPEFEAYENAEHDFAIQTPVDWLVLEGSEGTQAAFVEPAGTDPLAFRTNLSVIVRELPAGLEPSAIFHAQLNDLSPALTDPVLIDVETDLGPERPWQRVLIGYRSGIYPLTLEQWCVLAGTRSYLLSCTTTTGSYAQASPIFRAMVESLRTNGG